MDAHDKLLGAKEGKGHLLGCALGEGMQLLGE